MTTHADAIFETRNWDEGEIAAVDAAPKMTRALVTGGYTGDIEGQTTIAFIMYYPDEKNATYTGMERIEGQIAGRKGTFVLHHEGRFADGESRTTITVVPSSGTGDLQGLRGAGRAVAPMGSQATITFDYDFE